MGHLRRTRNIAREVLVREPDCRILTLADSYATPFFPLLRGMDYLKLPTIVRTGLTSWETGTPSLTTEEVMSIRAKVILEAFCEFNPDVVLVDHRPVGVMGELRPLLDRAAQAAEPPRLFLGLRDILDTPAVNHEVWTELGAYDYLRHYEAVLIYGCREVYDAETAYHLSPHARKVVYCNYVGPRAEASPPIERLDRPFVLMTGGGGGDAFPLAKTFLDALPMIVEETGLEAMLLPGPNMPVADRQVLRDRSLSYPVEVQGSPCNITPWVHGAVAVVSMGGYNSLCEVLEWQKKTLVVPREGPSAEQRIRSQIFSQRNLVRTLDPQSLTPECLAQGLIQLLADDDLPEPARMPPMDGARRAATLLLDEPGSAEEDAVAAQVSPSGVAA